jgi:seryl-tRNA synthetase
VYNDFAKEHLTVGGVQQAGAQFDEIQKEKDVKEKDVKAVNHHELEELRKQIKTLELSLSEKEEEIKEVKLASLNTLIASLAPARDETAEPSETVALKDDPKYAKYFKVNYFFGC